jgi:hypothetical protein
MPTYIGLEQQGFWKPFEMLGSALRSRADRGQRERFFTKEQDRLKMQDQLQRKQIKQQMKVNKFNFKQAKKAEGKRETLSKMTPETFKPTMVQAEQVLSEVGPGVTPESREAYLQDVMQPIDVTKPLHLQPPEVMTRLQQVSAETGIPQEDLHKKYEAMRTMYGGPTVQMPSMPASIPQVPGFSAAIQVPMTGGGQATFTQRPQGLFGSGGPQAVQPGTEVGGNTITSVSIDKQGMPSYSMKPTNQYKAERRMDIVKAVEGNKAVSNARKALGQFGMLQELVNQEDGTGQSDMAIIFNFMKTIDPDSVVRESEFRAAGKTGSLPQNIQVWFNKIITGEKLSPPMRQNFLTAAAASVRSLAENAQRTADMFDPDGFIGYNFHEDAAELLPPPEFATPQAAEAAGAAGKLFPGQKIIVRNEDGVYVEAKWVPSLPAGGNMPPPVTRPQ